MDLRSFAFRKLFVGRIRSSGIEACKMCGLLGHENVCQVQREAGLIEERHSQEIRSSLAKKHCENLSCCCLGHACTQLSLSTTVKVKSINAYEYRRLHGVSNRGVDPIGRKYRFELSYRSLSLYLDRLSFLPPSFPLSIQ